MQYFEHFVKSSFRPPFSQIVAPHALDPHCFDFLLDPDCRLKVASICLGPFDWNPSGIKLKVKMRDFKSPKIFHSSEAIRNNQGIQQVVTFEAQANKFYVLVMLNLPEVVVSEDVCIMVSTRQKAKIKNF